MGKKKQNTRVERLPSFTDTSICDYSTKEVTEKFQDMRSDSSSVQPQLSALFPYGESSLDDLTETRSEFSFTGTEHLWDSDRKYSISRFKYNNNVYDEIMKRMGNEENDMRIQDSTKVGAHQFLTYQIIIKTNDSIYFIKPKDKKCFLLNKSSVSEMVAPTTTFNAEGDKISVAKFAFVQLENGSTSNSKNSTIKGYKDSQYSKNILSSSETEPPNQIEIDSVSETDQKIPLRPRSDIKKQKKTSGVSNIMIKSAKKESYQMKKMSHVTYSKPYLYSNIVFYSTASSRNADQVFQDKYFAFVKNKIKNKLSNSLNQNKNTKQSGGDQNPEVKNTALTTEYVDHFWERNKMKDCKLMFTLEPDFYTKAFQSKCNVKSQSNECVQPTRLSDLLSRPSKHDSFLSNLLDLKLRDIMSYIWNSSSRTKLPSISGSQDAPLKVGELSNRDVPRLGKTNFPADENHSNLPKSVSNHCIESDGQNTCPKPPPLSKQFILIHRESTDPTSDEEKVTANEGSKSSQVCEQNNETQNTGGKPVSKFTSKRSDPENQISSEGTSSFVNHSGTRCDDMRCSDKNLNDFLLQNQSEEGNKCVLALSPDEDELGRKSATIETKKSTGTAETQSIVEKSNMELKSLMSLVEVTSSSSRRSGSKNSNPTSSAVTNSKWNSRSNIQSQASLSASSNSCSENQPRKMEKFFIVDQFSSRNAKNQQLLRESMLESVIPEDSIISLVSRSHDSINKMRSPACTSESACSNNIEANEDDLSPHEKTYSYTENDLSTSACNLSLLAVELDGNLQNSGKNWYPFTDKSGSAKKSSANFESSVNEQSNQTLMNNCSRQSLFESNGRLASKNKTDKRKLRKRKSTIETVKKIGEKVSKSCRRTFTVKGFKSEKSIRNERSHRSVRKMRECREPHQYPSYNNRLNLEIGQSSIQSEERSSAEDDKFSKITCDYKNVAISCSEGDLKSLKDSKVGCVLPRRLQKKKDHSKQKSPASNVAVLSHCEGNKVEMNKKSHRKKQRLRNRFETDEAGRKSLFNELCRKNGVCADRKLAKNYKFGERCVQHDLSAPFLIDEFPRRVDSESSLSSYKTVNSYLLYDGKCCKEDPESETSTESTNKSAIQTFIGPSAIDGMLNIINLFYARQKPDECSC